MPPSQPSSLPAPLQSPQGSRTAEYSPVPLTETLPTEDIQTHPLTHPHASQTSGHQEDINKVFDANHEMGLGNSDSAEKLTLWQRGRRAFTPSKSTLQTFRDSFEAYLPRTSHYENFSKWNLAAGKTRMYIGTGSMITAVIGVAAYHGKLGQVMKVLGHFTGDFSKFSSTMQGHAAVQADKLGEITHLLKNESVNLEGYTKTITGLSRDHVEAIRNLTETMVKRPDAAELTKALTQVAKDLKLGDLMDSLNKVAGQLEKVSSLLANQTKVG